MLSSTRLIRNQYIESEEVVLEIRHQLVNEIEEPIEDQNDSIDPKEIVEKILADAEVQAHQIKMAAAQKGYAEGLEKARAEGQIITDKARGQAEELLANLEQYHMDTLEAITDEIRDLVIQITEKIIRNEISQGIDVTTNLVKTAIEEVKSRKKVNIFVNPKDLDLVEQAKDLLNTKLERGRIELLADPSIGLGGCRIHTEMGWVDATIDNQFKELQDLLALETR